MIDLPDTSFADLSVELLLQANGLATSISALEYGMVAMRGDEMLTRITERRLVEMRASAKLLGDAHRLLKLLSAIELEIRALAASYPVSERGVQPAASPEQAA